MVSTSIENTFIFSGYGFYENQVIIQCDKLSGHTIFDGNNHNEININDIINSNFKTLNFTSKNKKVLVSLSAGPYHFFTNTVTSILEQAELDHDLVFILDLRNISDRDNSFVNFLYDLLTDNNIKYIAINTRNADFILIDNFYYIQDYNFGVKHAGKILEKSKPYIKNLNVIPYKKAYLSRKKIGDRSYSDLFKNIPRINNISFDNDNRIYNEKELEDFFEQNGFDIIVPEDFSNFKEQINYFYSVKTLVSVTSSGITNSLFMQNGGNILELITPLTIHFWDSYDYLTNSPVLTGIKSELHHFYHGIAYIKNHNYFGIPNKTRLPKDIIDRIQNNSSLMELIK